MREELPSLGLVSTIPPFITCQFICYPNLPSILWIALEGSFFWQGGGIKKKYHLIKWEKICKNKKKRGVGIKNLRKMNLSLLCKWWWRLETENGLWQEIIRYKYLKTKSIHEVSHCLYDSQMWYDLLKSKTFTYKVEMLLSKMGRK